MCLTLSVIYVCVCLCVWLCLLRRTSLVLYFLYYQQNLTSDNKTAPGLLLIVGFCCKCLVTLVCGCFAEYARFFVTLSFFPRFPYLYTFLFLITLGKFQHWSETSLLAYVYMQLSVWVCVWMCSVYRMYKCCYSMWLETASTTTMMTAAVTTRTMWSLTIILGGAMAWQQASTTAVRSFFVFAW